MMQTSTVPVSAPTGVKVRKTDEKKARDDNGSGQSGARGTRAKGKTGRWKECRGNDIRTSKEKQIKFKDVTEQRDR